MTSRHYFLARIVSSTVLIALTGCGKSGSQSAADLVVAAATGGKVQVSQSGRETTVKTDQGVEKISTGGNVAIPSDFPKDVHLPSSAYKVNSVVQMGQAMVVVLHTQTAMSALFAEYHGSMTSAGWKEAMAMQSSDSGSLLSFQNGNRVLTVTLAKQAGSDGGTDVSLQYVVQKPGG